MLIKREEIFPRVWVEWYKDEFLKPRNGVVILAGKRQELIAKVISGTPTIETPYELLARYDESQKKAKLTLHAVEGERRSKPIFTFYNTLLYGIRHYPKENVDKTQAREAIREKIIKFLEGIKAGRSDL